ncbi:MAG: MBL fold metallo-hydrolase [Candidatus Eremiobacteraeota bacterium]|nr:MBL fold metallo-hydrolase [Candidatus Eremiobacteraeota bacterium]
MNDSLGLQVVGSSPAMPRPGGANSCYLVRAPGSAVVLDIGSGAAGKLQCAAEYAAVDAILISHMHPDHFFDLVALRHGLKYGERTRTDPMPLWLPPGGIEVLSTLSTLISEGGRRSFFDDAYVIHEYEPAVPLFVGQLRITFARTQHFVSAYAIRVEHNGKTLTYSADTAPCDSVVEHARGADLFLCEAALGLDSEQGERGHCNAYEAGEMASRAGARRLALTHYPARFSPPELVAAAKQRFDRTVELADDGADFSV